MMRQPETQYRPPIPQTPEDLVLVTALSITSWILTALYFSVSLSTSSCRRDPGMTIYCLDGAIWMMLLLIVVSIVLSAITAVSALIVAFHAEDWISAAALGILLVATAFAAYALLQNGHSDHPLVTAVYGFPPDGLSLHAIAYYGSAALVVVMPLIVLAYALTSEQAQRVSAAAGPLLVLGLWIAIRLAG